MKYWMLLFALLWVSYGTGMARKTEKVVNNGIPWFDDRGEIVNAHGACIVEENGRYYLFGEYKSDKSNAFPGFSCYSSDDLVNWKFERVVLPMQSSGILGPDRVGERVKVMKCPSTGEYVMYMHADDMNYKDPHIGYATCSTIAGEYKLHGPLLYEGKDGMYFFLFSNLTSWEKNDNFYFTAPSVKGPWTRQGLFAPEGSLTYNSQTTFVFPLKCGEDTIPMFMGDRWSYPHQASAATYVWMPMQVDGTKLSIPEYWPSWDVDKLKPVNPLRKGKTVDLKKITFSKEADWKVEEGRISSNVKGSTLSIPFTGSCVAVMGETNCHSGYARMNILDKKGEKIYSSLVDFYSKANDHATRFKTPQLAEGEYTLVIEVTGISPTWTDKTKRIYGSDDCFVTITDIVKL